MHNSTTKISTEAKLSLSDPISAERALDCHKVVMRREFSAGVVLVRRMRGAHWFAAVRPQGKPEAYGRFPRAW